jgi:predicted transcriptional regulator of viral defense system
MPPPTKSDLLARLAKRGLVRARDLAAEGIPRAYLQRLVDRDVLEQVGRGLYRLADSEVTELHSLAVVSKRVPHGTVCLLSALSVHGLTTEAPSAVWLMIDRKARAPAVDTPRLELVRASGRARTHGVETLRVEGVDVRITAPAKTVADCFRYRSRVGLDVAIEALRAYLTAARARRRRASSIDELFAAAKANGVARVIRPYVEALA